MKMKLLKAGLAVLGLTLLTAPAANAVPITGLFNTGVNASGTPLALGALDPHYTVLENAGAQAVVLNPPNGAYLPNSATSQWIWQTSNGQPGNVNRTFRTTFSLTGTQAASGMTAIDGFWATDNQGIDILINGISTGNSLLGVVVANFQSLHAFTTISTGFVAGTNTLDFVIQDNGPPGAFRAELAGTSVVPEPGTLAILGLGLVGLGLARRRNKAA